MDNFIEVYKNVFDSDYCDNAIKFFNHVEQIGMTKNRQEHEDAPKINKEDTSYYIPGYPLTHSDPSIHDPFLDKFWGICYKQYAEKYSILNTLSSHNIYTMKLQKTKPGQGYHVWHCESTSKELSNRLLTWTVYLNDEFEAGETEFLYQQYRYKPNKGDVVIFPAAYTHTHRGNPPIGGDKYIITGWVEY